MGHHYVPQQYLRGFEIAEATGLIWAYDKVEKQLRKVPIRAAAQEAGYYDPDTERRLNEEVEGPAQGAFNKLRLRQQLTAQDRLALSAYVAVMTKRVPAHRRRALGMAPSVVEQVLNEFHARIEEWAQSPTADQALVAQRRIEMVRARERLTAETPEEVLGEVRSPWPNNTIVEAINAMNWRLLEAPPDNPFLTSDNPAFYFSSDGLAQPTSELTFPLFHDLALLGSWQGPQHGLAMLFPRPALVREVNRRVASSAERFVFCSKDKDWLATLSNKRPRLHRVRW